MLDTKQTLIFHIASVIESEPGNKHRLGITAIG